jgi:hypothetical protein
MVAIAADARPTIKKIGNRSFFLLIFLLYLLLQRLTNLLYLWFRFQRLTGDGNKPDQPKKEKSLKSD